MTGRRGTPILIRLAVGMPLVSDWPLQEEALSSHQLSPAL
jgi:hypothetical protein